MFTILCNDGRTRKWHILAECHDLRTAQMLVDAIMGCDKCPSDDGMMDLCVTDGVRGWEPSEDGVGPWTECVGWVPVTDAVRGMPERTPDLDPGEEVDP